MAKNTVFIKIAQQGIMFRDAKQGIKVVGDKVVEVEKTYEITSGIKNGLIEEVEAPTKKGKAKEADADAGKDKEKGDADKDKTLDKDGKPLSTGTGEGNK